MSMRNNNSLTAKEQAFCEEYIKNGHNATQAYLTSYGGAITTAHNTGFRVLRRPQVKAYIDKLEKEAYEAAHITAEAIALKLAEMGFAAKDDNYYTPNVQLKALDLMQKQLGLQQQKVSADVNAETTITVNVGDEQNEK